MPEWFEDRIPGQCRWCGKAIPPTKTGRASKATWHPACVDEYMIVAHQSKARQAVWKRDRGVCRTCGKQCGRRDSSWHMDHIRPLWEANGDISFWQLPNLQSLCTECHKVKTASEATERARRKRT